MSTFIAADLYQEIAELSRADIAKQKILLPPDTIRELCSAYKRQHRSLRNALEKNTAGKKIIAGIQKNFPAEAMEVGEFDALKIASSFEKSAASALAVVTEKHFFGGSPSMLSGITHLVKLPVIRWDFIVDEYQILQSRLWGADAIRLIVSLLEPTQLTDFCQVAAEQELEVVAEIHSLAELEQLSSLPTMPIIAIDTVAPNPALLSEIISKIPHNTPALFNGDYLTLEDIDSIPLGAVFFASKLIKNPQILTAKDI